MKTSVPLPPDELCRRCDPARLAFATTEELEALEGILGQPRALGAIEFGVGMRREGYNLFAMGPEGVGRHTAVRRHLERQAKGRPTPSDWCYVFNFRTPHRPRALRFPAGEAGTFRRKMERLLDELRAAIPAAFETDEYRNRRQEIESELGERQEKAFGEVGDRARAQGVALLRTPTGFGFAPTKGDKVMEPEEFRQLPAEEQARLEGLIGALQEELERAIRDVPKWRREALHKLRELTREATRAAVNSLIDDLRDEYAALPEAQRYLSEVKEDVLEHAEAFGEPKEVAEALLRRYAVNLLIEHEAGAGAPVVYEDHPRHDALVGRIEHIAQMGALVTDFTLIKAGALHRANGGYLVLDALRLLSQPFAWEALKRALRARQIRTESLGQELSVVSTVSLEPEAIPLEVKVVLVGQRRLYYLLHAYDPEFAELFKVAVDFEEDMPRTPEADLELARAVATLARKEGLRALDAGAVARVIEDRSREAEDAGRLSASLRGLADLLREADYWAGAAGRGVIAEADVRRAIDARVERSARVRDRIREDILRGSLLIDTAGTRSAQVNGLAVVQLGELAFGVPHRITARTRLGSGGVVDIEREAELGGPIHSKGVLILSGYLAGRYARAKPLSLSASLVFEQSYGGVEGDSASSAELYALLSALAGAPVAQSLAVTGSVNQLGDVQAIGGVNPKIEGFFDLCRERGLTGGQGVLIPESNVKNLMLRHDVVEACAAGRFSVIPVASVDEGIALLTGLSADEIHARVEERLSEYAEHARAFGLPARVNARARRK